MGAGCLLVACWWAADNGEAASLLLLHWSSAGSLLVASRFPAVSLAACVRMGMGPIHGWCANETRVLRSDPCFDLPWRHSPIIPTPHNHTTIAQRLPGGSRLHLSCPLADS